MDRRRPGQAETAHDVGFDLRSEPEGEASARQLLQRPRAHRRHRRAAREGDRHRRPQTQALGRLRREGEDGERVVLGLLDDQPTVPHLLEQPGHRRDGVDVERRVRGAQPGIDLAEGEQRLQPHAAGS